MAKTKSKGALKSPLSPAPPFKGAEQDSDMHLSVRKISNGYITRKSMSRADGSGESSETYSAEHPDRAHDAKEAAGHDTTGCTSLRDAVDYMNSTITGKL